MSLNILDSVAVCDCCMFVFVYASHHPVDHVGVCLLCVHCVVFVDASHALLRIDSRADVLLENSALASAFIKTLFGVLYEVYSSSVSYVYGQSYSVVTS